jgi:hypothetical protein
MEQERATHRLRVTDVGDEQAKAWYAQHRYLFAELASTRVSWARLDDEALARDLLARSTGGDRHAFLAIVRAAATRGVKASGEANLDHDGRGADISVTRIAFALRQADRVGMVEAPDGQWWLARVDATTEVEKPWDATLALQVKSAIANEQEEKAFDTLVVQLKRKWPVREFPERFTAIKEQ